jgi:hypothetical protein
LDDANFAFLSIPHDTLTAGATSELLPADDDAVYRRYYSDEILTEADVQIVDPTGDVDNVRFVSVDTDVATVNAITGSVSRVADGTARIVAKSRLLNRTVDVPVVLTQTQADRFDHFVEGSLFRTFADGVDSRIAVEGAEASIFSTRDHTNGVYVRNANCWANDVDMSGLGFCWKWPTSQAVINMALITPQDVIGAAHYTVNANGQQVRFVTPDNELVTATLSSYTTYGLGFGGTDIMVGHLDRRVDVDGITPVKLFPADMSDYYSHKLERAPSLVLNKYLSALVYERMEYDGYSPEYYIPTDADRLSFYQQLLTGDSGSAIGHIINDEFVLATHISTAGGLPPGQYIRGPNYCDYLDLIAAMLDSLGGGYQLTEVDLSGFTSYA